MLNDFKLLMVKPNTINRLAIFVAPGFNEELDASV
jgi:hypothetical protein